MTYPLYLAFIWHHHQPLYKSSGHFGGEHYHLPWVRLHSVKDYLDLIEVLAHFPQLHQTVSLSPTLMMQWEDYATGQAMDPYLSLSVMPVEQLTIDQKTFILESFFDAYYPTQIAPHPRYKQLYVQRQEQGVLGCLENWQPQDYEDLLTWHNLAWLDPLWRINDAEIKSWFNKQRGFTLGDRQRLIAKQRQIIRQILPRHRQLQSRGQLELITCPYSHPLLPLLADTNSARSTQPEAVLPAPRFCWSEDIALQLRKARSLYRQYFGRDPQGLWSPELAVSPESLAAIAQSRWQWLCADEHILAHTLHQPLSRDRQGYPLRPELLYHPYRVETPDGYVNMVFRDQRLSDLIGFGYAHRTPQEAVKHLVNYLKAIALRLQHQQSQKTPGGLQYPWLITVALEGEKGWQRYPQDGLPFLKLLYETLHHLTERGQLKLVTVSEYLELFPPTHLLKSYQIHPGSWIEASYSTWIGDRHKNRAWDYLIDARQTLANHPEATEDNNPEAWEALYAAESSDWFKWFGQGNTRAQDAIFDQLFRQHLINVYRALNEIVPSYLYQPLQNSPPPPSPTPWGYIHPAITVASSPEDWQQGGRVELLLMDDQLHSNEWVKTLIYGYDLESFYLRLELRPGIDLEAHSQGVNEFHLLWYYPGKPLPNSPAPLASLPDQPPGNYYFHHHLGLNWERQTLWLEAVPAPFQWQTQACQAQFALGESLVMALPWQDLQQPPQTELHLVLIFAQHGEYQSRVWPGDLLKVRIP